MPSVGPLELVIVLAIVLVVFGVGKISGIGGALGRSIREFRQEARPEGEEPGAEDDIEAVSESDEKESANP